MSSSSARARPDVPAHRGGDPRRSNRARGGVPRVPFYVLRLELKAETLAVKAFFDLLETGRISSQPFGTERRAVSSPGCSRALTHRMVSAVMGSLVSTAGSVSLQRSGIGRLYRRSPRAARLSYAIDRSDSGAFAAIVGRIHHTRVLTSSVSAGMPRYAGAGSAGWRV